MFITVPHHMIIHNVHMSSMNSFNFYMWWYIMKCCILKPTSGFGFNQKPVTQRSHDQLKNVLINVSLVRV